MARKSTYISLKDSRAAAILKMVRMLSSLHELDPIHGSKWRRNMISAWEHKLVMGLLLTEGYEAASSELYYSILENARQMVVEYIAMKGEL